MHTHTHTHNCFVSFVTIYLDDILVHSKNEGTHKEHLEIVFKHLSEAGLSHWDDNCAVFKTCIFSRWNVRKYKFLIPTSATEVRQFLGLITDDLF